MSLKLKVETLKWLRNSGKMQTTCPWYFAKTIHDRYFYFKICINKPILLFNRRTTTNILCIEVIVDKLQLCKARSPQELNARATWVSRRQSNPRLGDELQHINKNDRHAASVRLLSGIVFMCRA